MANLLTALRLLLIAPVVYGIINPETIPGIGMVGLLLIAIASDYFDGKIARATNTASPAGMLFDHGTDFLFVTSSMAALSYTGLLNPLLPILVAAAFSQYVLDSYFLFKQKQLKMSLLGRWNGIFYFGPVLLVSCSRIAGIGALQDVFATLALTLSYILIVSTLLSIVDRATAPLRESV